MKYGKMLLPIILQFPSLFNSNEIGKVISIKIMVNIFSAFTM